MDTPSTKTPMGLLMPPIVAKHGIISAVVYPDKSVYLFEAVAADCKTVTLISLNYYYSMPMLSVSCGAGGNDQCIQLRYNWEHEQWETLVERELADGKWSDLEDI